MLRRSSGFGKAFGNVAIPSASAEKYCHPERSGESWAESKDLQYPAGFRAEHSPPTSHQMSIATKTGDDGTTALMYGRRVSKTDPRVAAYGTVDELNAALGMVRATVGEPFVTGAVLAIQKELVTLMGELAVAPED